MFTAESANSNAEGGKSLHEPARPSEHPKLTSVKITKPFELFAITEENLLAGWEYFLEYGDERIYLLKGKLKGEEIMVRLKSPNKTYKLALEIMENGEELTWERLQMQKQLPNLQ